MSIMDELKKLTRGYDEEGFDDPDLDIDLEEPTYTRPAPVEPVQPVAEPVMNMGGAGMGGGFVSEMPRTPVSPISMGSTADASKYRVVLVKPEEFGAATDIAKHICQGDTVILNCEETNEQVARRVIDFLSGCAFALEGSIKKASTNVYIIAPRDVGVDDADQENQAEA